MHFRKEFTSAYYAIFFPLMKLRCFYVPAYSGIAKIKTFCLLCSIFWQLFQLTKSNFEFTERNMYILLGIFSLFKTLYHTIRPFYEIETEAILKHCGKRRKCWQPFPTMFSTLPKPNFNFSFTFILSSANNFYLD